MSARARSAATAVMVVLLSLAPAAPARAERGRGLAGARRLVALRRQGCDVKVIFGAAPGDDVRRVLSGGRVSWCGARHRRVHTHQKLLIVNGVIGSDPWATRVFTGSHNWTDQAADRDEVVLGIKDARTAQLYTQNWNYVWRKG